MLRPKKAPKISSDYSTERKPKKQPPGDSSRDLFSPLVGGHQQPLKGSLKHLKKDANWIIRFFIPVKPNQKKSLKTSSSPPVKHWNLPDFQVAFIFTIPSCRWEHLNGRLEIRSGWLTSHRGRHTVQGIHSWTANTHVLTLHSRTGKPRESSTPVGGFLKWWYLTTMGFPTRNDHLGVFWGYHHLRKHPVGMGMGIFFRTKNFLYRFFRIHGKCVSRFLVKIPTDVMKTPSLVNHPKRNGQWDVPCKEVHPKKHPPKV